MADKKLDQTYREPFVTVEAHFNQEDIEIAAITAGSGNGWQFSAGVLQQLPAPVGGRGMFCRPRLAAALRARSGRCLFAAALG